MPASADLYISADVETDGPIPGPYSLLSFGLSVAGCYDGRAYWRADPAAQTFYAELRPISDAWEPEALAVNRLDRSALVQRGQAPSVAMENAARWVGAVAENKRAVLVAYPVAFDWAFLYWYFVRFAPSGSPFGYSSCLDVRTLYQARAHGARSIRQAPHAARAPARPTAHAPRAR